MKLGILGGGSWGTALGILWAQKGHPVQLWVRNAQDAETFEKERRNTKYLPDTPFPDNLTATNDLEGVINNSQLICLAVPLQAYRAFLRKIKDQLADYHQILILSKGIELETHQLPTQIVLDVLGHEWKNRTYTLSGPSFAKEVAELMPTTVVLAGNNTERLTTLQKALNCPTFRMYRNRDVAGVELCAALKNVIAIASGMTQGLNLGSNTMAGLITRGLAEISRLAVALGGKQETCAGLAGMGDLILTCTGSLSRNLRVGQALARGEDLKSALNNLGMVAEGVHTCRSAWQLGRQLGVELPITNVINQILYEDLSPRDALEALMSRSLKSEHHSDTL